MRKQAFLFLFLLLATGLLFASCASQTAGKGSSANSSSPANAGRTETQTSAPTGGIPPAGATTAGTCPSAADRIRTLQEKTRPRKQHGRKTTR